MASTTPSETSSQANRQIARAAGTVMLAIVLGQLIGLGRNMFISQVFGTSTELDSFFAANRVAEMLFNLVAGGALASAFVPTFTGFLTREDRDGAWKLASAVANWVLLVLVAVSLLAAIFAPQVVRHGLFVLAPGQDAGQEELTVHLLRVLLPTVAIFGVSGMVMGALNAHQVFLAPALAPSMYSIGQILGVALLTPSLGIMGLAWGAVLGAVLHLAVQVPALLKIKGRYIPILGLDIPAVRQVARLMGPRLFGVAVVQLNFVVNIVIATSLGEGSISAITFAFALMIMPQAAIAQAIATAAMPTFSAQVARGKVDEMRHSVAASLRGILLLSIPASVGLIMLRTPVVALVYQRGIFTSESTGLVAWALLWYGAGLVGHSVVELLSRAFYALHDTKTPVTIGVIVMSLNILFSFLFVDVFGRIGWAAHGGLALANSLATTFEAVALLVFLRRKLGGLNGQAVWSGFGQAGLSAAAMAAALYGWLRWMGGAQAVGLVAIVGVALGGGVYGLGMLLLRVPELRGLAKAVQRRFVR